MVKPVNTPMAYREMSEDTLAPVATSSATDTTVSTMMPFEKTSRCPRRVNWRGRKESSPTKLARNGNPVKLVLAASTRMSSVAIWRK